MCHILERIVLFADARSTTPTFLSLGYGRGLYVEMLRQCIGQSHGVCKRSLTDEVRTSPGWIFSLSASAEGFERGRAAMVVQSLAVPPLRFAFTESSAKQTPFRQHAGDMGWYEDSGSRVTPPDRCSLCASAGSSRISGDDVSRAGFSGANPWAGSFTNRIS